jgi:hypothetical protein
MLHTPWFIQTSGPSLEAWAGRISCEATQHYIKYAALSPDGSRIFLSGAKLIEDERQGSEARWGSWILQEGVWTPDWADALESYANSHLRGVQICPEGSALSLELYHQSYELRIFDASGKLRHRRERAEHACISGDARYVLWESQADGLVLAEGGDLKKRFTRRLRDRVRHKQLGTGGQSFIIEGRHAYALDREGKALWEGYFINDPYRISVSADGGSLAMVYGKKAALLKLPAC